MNSVRRVPSTMGATEAWATGWKQHTWTLSMKTSWLLSALRLRSMPCRDRASPLCPSGKNLRKRGLRLPGYPSIVFEESIDRFDLLRIWNGILILWLLMQRAKVLCDVSQQEVLEEEMTIFRLLGPKAIGKTCCHLIKTSSMQSGVRLYFTWNYIWKIWKQWCVAMSL